ncbi:MAG: mechanosensitive ion channel family protein [Anaerolineae bacterium]|nr:mechanosensitive ion channel family protein [Anaerolineae bacterium]
MYSVNDVVRGLAGWPWPEIGLRGAGILLTWLAVWLVNRSVWPRLRRRLSERRGIAEREIQPLSTLLTYALITAGILITLALANLTPLLYSALTAAGVAGIIIGFAVKDLASNFISGLFILLDRPFVVGDVIKVGEFAGTVTDIALRTTTIQTFDGPAVFIPNSMVATSPVTNFSTAELRRVGLTVSVFQDCDIQRAMSLVAELAEHEERVAKEPAPSVYVEGVRDGMVTLQWYGYVRPADVLTVPSDLRRRIVEEFRRQGIRLGMPVQLNLTPKYLETGATRISQRAEMQDGATEGPHL